MRRVPVLLVTALMLVAAMPSVASAHRSVRESDSRTTLFCDFITNEQGTINVVAEISETYGSHASLTYWELPAVPDEAPPTWYSAEGQASLSTDGTLLSATVDLYEFVEEPMPEEPATAAVAPPDPGESVGQAVVSATLVPVGDPEPYRHESTDTNMRYRVEGLVQHHTVEGQATLPGDISFDLSTCEAMSDTYTFFGTNPDAFVGRSEGAWVGCSWQTDAYAIGLGAYREGTWAGADVFISDVSGEYYGATGEAAMSAGELFAEVDIVSAGEPDLPGIGEPVGHAVVRATLDSTGDRQRFSQRYGFEKYRSVVEQLTASGTLELTWPGGDLTLALDAASCSGEEYRFSQQSPTPNGTPTVKAVANDLPENARPIAVGESDRIRDTAGTSPEPEAPCTVIDPEFGEPIEVPVTNTAWWTLEGTGGEVTVDTAGSAFDTVVGVYLTDADGLAQVACVDDIFEPAEQPSLQARVTFATEPGVSYLIQVGGYGFSTGRLELSVR